MATMVTRLHLRNLGHSLGTGSIVRFHSIYCRYAAQVSNLIDGNVVGCGIDFTQHKVFYTVDGKLIGKLTLHLTTIRLRFSK